VRSRVVALVLVACLLFTPACASARLTELEAQLYAAYLADEDAPELEGPWLPGLAAVLSLFVPGLGHFYLVEPSTGVLWATFGLVTVPFGGPVIAAYSDADTYNQRSIARQYEEHLARKRGND